MMKGVWLAALGVVAGVMGAEGLTCQVYLRNAVDTPSVVETCPDEATACISYSYTLGTDPAVQQAAGACATGSCNATQAVVQTAADQSVADGQTVPINDWSCALCETDDCNEVISVAAVDIPVNTPPVATSGYIGLVPAISAMVSVGLATPLIFN